MWYICGTELKMVGYEQRTKRSSRQVCRNGKCVKSCPLVRAFLWNCFYCLNSDICRCTNTFLIFCFVIAYKAQLLPADPYRH